LECAISLLSVKEALLGRITRLVGSASLAIAPLATLPAQGLAPFTIAAPSFAPYVGTSIPLHIDIADSAKIRPLAVRSPSWESSDASKAWVTPQGTVVLLAPGHVTIRARMGSFMAERVMDIRNSNVRRVEVRAAKVTALPGEPVRIDVVATDDDARVVNAVRPTLAVAGEGAAIDNGGRFVGFVPGSYLVVAELGGVTATQRIDVTGSRVQQQGWPIGSGFEIRPPKFDAYTQTALQLETSLNDVPADGIAWGVSDTSVASVSPSGLLELRRPGRVRVWASARGARAEREIKVLANPAADVALRLEAKDVHVGDRVRVTFDAWARGSRPVENAHVLYAVASTDAPRDGARMKDDGTFIANAPGTYTIIASLGGRADRQTIVVRPR
jgi:hypothetical protein